VWPARVRETCAAQIHVREIFSTKREEVRPSAATIITRKLNADGIVVKR